MAKIAGAGNSACIDGCDTARFAVFRSDICSGSALDTSLAAR
jgi:hypothetical protein